MSDKNKFLYISIVSIVFSFFLGYAFAYRTIVLENVTENTYVDISTSTKNITIKNAPENIFFRVNGEIFQTGSIDLKKVEK